MPDCLDSMPSETGFLTPSRILSLVCWTCGHQEYELDLVDDLANLVPESLSPVQNATARLARQSLTQDLDGVGQDIASTYGNRKFEMPVECPEKGHGAIGVL